MKAFERQSQELDGKKRAALVVEIQRNVPDPRGPRRGSPECGF